MADLARLGFVIICNYCNCCYYLGYAPLVVGANPTAQLAPRMAQVRPRVLPDAKVGREGALKSLAVFVVQTAHSGLPGQILGLYLSVTFVINGARSLW